MTYYHYTCSHGREQIGTAGKLLPAFMLTDNRVPWPGRFVWLTDMAIPEREPLGLTSNFISCDRTAHRYRVTDTTGILPWHVAAHTMARSQREDLEGAPGARPMHWFVSVAGVPVVLDERDDDTLRCEWCGGPGASDDRACMVAHCEACACRYCADDKRQEAGC